MHRLLEFGDENLREHVCVGHRPQPLHAACDGRTLRIRCGHTASLPFVDGVRHSVLRVLNVNFPLAPDLAVRRCLAHPLCPKPLLLRTLTMSSSACSAQTLLATHPRGIESLLGAI